MGKLNKLYVEDGPDIITVPQFDSENDIELTEEEKFFSFLDDDPEETDDMTELDDGSMLSDIFEEEDSSEDGATKTDDVAETDDMTESDNVSETDNATSSGGKASTQNTSKSKSTKRKKETKKTKDAKETNGTEDGVNTTVPSQSDNGVSSISAQDLATMEAELTAELEAEKIRMLNVTSELYSEILSQREKAKKNANNSHRRTRRRSFVDGPDELQGNASQESTPQTEVAEIGTKRKPWEAAEADKNSIPHFLTNSQTVRERSFEQVKRYMDHNDWSYEEDKDILCISGGVALKGRLSSAKFVIRFYPRGLAVVSGLGIRIRAEEIHQVAEFLHRINYNLIDGAFELDMDDGTLRFRVNINYEDVDHLTDSQIETSLLLGPCMIDSIGDELMKVIFGICTPAEAANKVND